MDAVVDQPNVKRPPIEEGDYLATVGEVKPNSGEKDGRAWVQMILPLQVDVPPDQQAKVGADKITLSDRVFLDVTEQGTLDISVGKNRGMRQYRDATDLNKPGDTFSWRMLQGRMVKVKIKHELYEGEVQERIAGVAKA